MKTRLLVSVRDAAEATIALEAGVDVIDIKEPKAGSLGAASHHSIAAIVRTVNGARPLSVALGELIEDTPHRGEILSLIQSAGGVSFAKIGLANTIAVDRKGNDWRSHWLTALRALPDSVSGVAVVYADWKTARAPAPRDVIKAGSEFGCRTMLIDTFDKRLPGLLRLWSVEEITNCLAAAREAEMQVVLAGRLSADDLPAVLALAPDLIAVRGAVCGGDRAGSLDAVKLRDFQQRMTSVM